MSDKRVLKIRFILDTHYFSAAGGKNPESERPQTDSAGESCEQKHPGMKRRQVRRADIVE
jgi:hypothetical protein